MIESIVNAKGQTTLPKVVRDALSVQPGDRIRYVIEGKQVRILPVRPIEWLYGVLQYDGPTVTLEGMERAIADGGAESAQAD